MDYELTIRLRVTDEQRVIDKAYQVSRLNRSESINVAEALRLLLDRSDFLDGAEIQDSWCVRVD